MSLRAKASLPLTLLAALALIFAPTAAAGPVAKDGKIHACYKAKGKGKGTLRLVRNGKVRCPKKWKKVAWSASGVPGAQGESGSRGEAGEGGTGGTPGLPGTTGTVTVKALEDKVTELLTKVKSLESILSGINNQQLKEAIAAVPVVDALCTQAKALNEQSSGLGTALGGLAAIVDVLNGLGTVPSIPGALPSFECP
jgi:hypothetical protein